MLSSNQAIVYDIQRNQVPGINTVYPILDSILLKAQHRMRQDAFTGNTQDEFKEWQARSITTLYELLGLHHMETAPLEPQIDEVVVLEDGIVRQHLRIQTEPGVWMTAYVLVPANCSRSTPVVICPHGHNCYGKYGVAGCYEYPAVLKQIEHYHCDYGRRIAQLGYVAICPDMRGFGERRSGVERTRIMPDALKCECASIAHMGEPLGITVLGMACWDLMRMVDYIEQRDDWNHDQIYCCGFSSGGMQTLYLTALEPRIRGAIISGYMYGFKDSLLVLNENCSCNYVPHLMEHYDMGDLASMICPRPLWIQSGRDDHLNGYRGIDNVLEQVDIIGGAYRCNDVETHLYHEICDGDHWFHQERLQTAMQFLASNSAQDQS